MERRRKGSKTDRKVKRKGYKERRKGRVQDSFRKHVRNERMAEGRRREGKEGGEEGRKEERCESTTPSESFSCAVTWWQVGW